MIHAGDSVLDAHDIAVELGQFQNCLCRNVAASIGGEVINVDITMDLIGQLVIIMQQRVRAKMEIVRRQDHDGIRTGIQAEIRKINDLTCHHMGGAHNELNPVIHFFNGKLGHFPALIHRHGKELTGAALHKDAIHALFNQVIKQFFLAFKIQGAVLIE